MAHTTPVAPNGRTARQSALSEIQFASILDGDLTPSEDETPEPTPEENNLRLEDAQSAIGISIGQQQTRLTSPKTPAAEKAAALDDVEAGGFFDNWQPAGDGTVDHDSPVLPTSSPEASGSESVHADERVTRHGTATSHHQNIRMPSPWRAGPKPFQRIDDHRMALRDSFTKGHRRRATSGSSLTDGLKKYIPFNLPSMPKSSLLHFSLPSFTVSSGLDNVRGRPADFTKRIRPTHGSIAQGDGSYHSKTDSPREWSHVDAPLRRPQPVPPGVPNAAPGVVAQAISRRPTPQLRRSNSEGSLQLYRSLSFASSLGDDSRFEHVSEQVNSRLKAIKDSWQDSNFKLPSMPSLPNFNLHSSYDLFRTSTPRTSTFGAPTLEPTTFTADSGARPRPRRDIRGSTTSLSASSSSISHPYLTKALQELEGDLVILGGYRGSILRSAEPPHRQLWVPIKVGLNLRKVDLELGLDPEDEETEEERIIPAGMLTHIGPVDIAKRLFKRLRASENAKNKSLRVHNYGYDWRLSPHILSRRLIEYLETLPCNQPGVPPEKRGAIVIAHSFGGLMTRHAVNLRPELFAGVTYAGVPKTCVNILGPLRNGDDVLLSSRVLTAQVNFTIRTSFALLPLDGKCFFNKYTKEEYPIDFFDINNWIKYCLSPCISAPLPALNAFPQSSISGMLNSMSQALPNLSILGRKGSMSKSSGISTPSTSTAGTHPMQQAAHTAHAAADKLEEESAQATTGFTPQMSMGHSRPAAVQTDPSHPQGSNNPSYSASTSNPGTTVTIPREKAIAYLTRVLSETKKFKQDLDFRSEHAESNAYPPIAVIYGKSTPTVYGAKVDSWEGIKRADAYDELAFASGDGVVLARAAQVPDGYSVVRGGVVSSDRGHVTLLGDLEAVGRCLVRVMEARRGGVGLGGAKVGGEEWKGKEKT